MGAFKLFLKRSTSNSPAGILNNKKIKYKIIKKK